ncbi:MAG: stage III sporulation protein AA [Anaerotignaceae bacterium]
MSIKNELIFAFGGEIRKILEKVSENYFNKAEEIRIRVNKPLLMKLGGENIYISKTGEDVTDFAKAYLPTPKDIKDILEVISGYSLYAFNQDIKKGFITIKGGHRVGVFGKALMEENNIIDIRHISSINVRVSREVKGCGNSLRKYLVKKGQVLSTLIISPPACGKTTLLRDLIRIIGNEGFNVSAIDERGEIGGSFQGMAKNDVGLFTDIMEGCPKDVGMKLSLRSMSPQVIAVDEIGESKDIMAIEEILCSGVSLLCTCHGDTLENLEKRENFKKLLDSFELFVFLESGNKIAKVLDREFIKSQRASDFVKSPATFGKSEQSFC